MKVSNKDKPLGIAVQAVAVAKESERSVDNVVSNTKEKIKPTSGVAMGDTSDVGVVKSSLHFRTLRNGKTIPLVSNSDPDRPRTNDSLQSTSNNEVDFIVLDKRSPS